MGLRAKAIAEALTSRSRGLGVTSGGLKEACEKCAAQLQRLGESFDSTATAQAERKRSLRR
jgi:hypothetical protein